jgi:nucleoside-diphosphate kinase
MIADKQRTLIFLKPDVFENKVVGKVINEIENHKGFTIVAMRKFHLSKKQAEEFYKVHKGKKFFDDLVKYITRGPILAMIVEGDDVIVQMRSLMGKTDPKEADKNSLRGKFGSSLDANVIHGSDSEPSAKDEIPFFFSKREML